MLCVKMESRSKSSESERQDLFFKLIRFYVALSWLCAACPAGIIPGKFIPPLFKAAVQFGTNFAAFLLSNKGEKGRWPGS